LENINKLKKEIYKISIRINEDIAFDTIHSAMEANILSIDDKISVLSQNDLNQYALQQDNLSPIVLNVKRIAKVVIENYIIASVKELHQNIIDNGRSEISKIENALELLKYDLLSQTGNEKNRKALLKQVNEQLAEVAENLKRLRVKQNVEINELLDTLKNALTVESIEDKVGDFGFPFQKINKKKFFDPIKNIVEKWAQRLNAFMVKSIDTVAKSEFQYKTKSLQNPHTTFADFSDKVSLSAKTAKKLPFYYNQLFTGKHSSQTEFLENRKSELLAFKKAVDRFNEGKNGAVLFTGDPLSGKTYLMHHAINQYYHKNVITISAPSQGALNDLEILDNAFANATGFDGDTTSILKQVKKKSTIVFEDLEMWWTRSASGSENLIRIIKLIKQFGNTHLFVLDCNTIFYQHIRQYLPLDEQLLATIITSSLPISEIEKEIMNRHRSGGMKFIWENKAEDKLSPKEKSNLFRKITAQTEGNIGMSFYLWIGHISKIEKNEIHFSDFNTQSFPVISNPEWENMLIQILMHKKITLNRLKEVYFAENGNDVENNLQSLFRTGLVVKSTSNSYSVSPYVLPYLMKYLYNKL